MTKLIDSGKLECLRREFDGLFAATEASGNCLIRTDQLETFQVARISEELLLVRPSCEREYGNYVRVENECRVFLLGEHFQVLAEVEPDVAENDHSRSPGLKEWTGEAIADAILKLEDPTRLHYLLLRDTGYDVESNGNRRDSIGGYDVKLYKLPKRWSLAEWATTERARRAQLTSTTAES